MNATQTRTTLPITRVRPAEGWNGLTRRELWEGRDLLQVLVWREVKVRYKQTLVGIVWVLGQPILTMIVMNVLLGRLVGAPIRDTPYPIFVYVALVPWAYFSHALTKAATCLVEHHGTISKVYFPRLLIPLAAILAGLVDFGVAFAFLPILMLVYGIYPSLTIAILPLLILDSIIVALGLGLWLAALNVAFRDVAFALPFLLQSALLVTPIFYSSEIVPEPWRVAYAMNPMVGVVEGMRWALLTPAMPIPWATIAISTVAAFVILGSGFYFFQAREPEFADLV